MKKLLLVVFLLTSFAFGNMGRSSGSHSSGRSTHTSKSKAPKAPKAAKTVHVKGHTRKDGTYVKPYDRSAPGTASHPADGQPYRKNYVAEGYAFHPSVERNSHGKIKRSQAAKGAFERQQPCPSTGKTSGRCPGYIVDHVKPLECGGADAPSNMQWQTKEAAKLKDKTEHLCRL
jgi:hypothetical protein